MTVSATHLRTTAGRGLSALGDALSNALCACIISYCVVSFFAGEAGILAYRDLKSGIELMDGRITALAEENAALASMRESLATDSDRMAREARDIGYLRPGEKIVAFSSAVPVADDSPMLHEIEPLRAGNSTGLPDRMVKILAAMMGGAVLLASLLMPSAPKKRSALKPAAERTIAERATALRTTAGRS